MIQFSVLSCQLSVKARIGTAAIGCPSGAQFRPLSPLANLAKLLHLQVLTWLDLLQNYTTFEPA